MLAVPTVAVSAHGQTDGEACQEAIVAGQVSKNEGKLLAAREALGTCLAVCAEVFHKDCSAWLTEVNESVPAFGVSVKGSNGNDTTDAEVLVDGTPFAPWVGKQLEVDPGEHKVTVRYAGAEKTVPLVAVAGDRIRKIEVSFAATKAVVVPPEPKVTPDESHPVAAYVLGAFSLVAFGSFAGFGITGKMEADEYYRQPDGCAHTMSCDEAEVSSTLTKLIVADVSLGVGVVAFGVGLGLFLDHHLNSPATAVQWRVTPVPGGMTAGIATSF